MAAAGLPHWPGTDGLTLRDILLSYPEAMAAGRVPREEELLREYPDLHDALQTFFVEMMKTA
jgi:hypothetical protein